jgi:16S rRNA processing protein RimM
VAADAIDTLVEIGVVGRPHGVRGEVRIFLHNPESMILDIVDSVHIALGNRMRCYALSSARRGNKCHVVRLQGISERSHAESITGQKVCVPRSALPPVATDEFYVADIIGLEAWDGDVFLGRVASSRSQGSIEVVTVTGDAEEMEIPLVEDFVLRIDKDKGRIEFFDTASLPRSPLRASRNNGSVNAI